MRHTSFNDQLNLGKLLRPQSVAVIGASRTSRVGCAGVENLIRHGYRGRIYPVNPKYDEILGLCCYPSVRAIPEAVDAALLLTAPGRALTLLEECGQAGVGAAVVVGELDGQAGTAGAEEQLVALAVRYRMAICGPNCMGILNGATGASLYLGVLDGPVPDGNVSVVLQSGSLGLALANSARSPGLRYLITSGNEMVLTAADYVQYLARDPGTQVIGLVLEGVRNPDHLLQGVRDAKHANKTVVLVKLGTSEQGRRLAASHTGALAGSAEVTTAVCRQFGIGQVLDVEELLQACTLLSCHAPPAGKRAGVVTLSGGYGTLVADLFERADLRLPEWSPQTSAALRPLVSGAMPSNPFDAWGHGVFEESARISVTAGVRDPTTDFLLVVQDLPPAGGPHRTDVPRAMVRVVAEESSAASKPVVMLGASADTPSRDLIAPLEAAGIPYVMGGGAAVRALAAWCMAGRPPPATGPAVARSDPQRLVPDELREAGIPLVPERLVTTAAAAAAAAAEVGYPAVLKISSPDLPHKSDVGGVMVGISPEGVESAFDRLMVIVGHAAPTARIRGVVVQRECPPGIEMIVGAVRDSDWGWIVTCGLGGVHVGTVGDAVFRRVPVMIDEAQDMLSELKASKLLAGFRGAPPRDRDALAELIVSVSEVARTRSAGIDQFEFNPVVVHKVGDGLSVVDTLFLPQRR